MLTSLFILASTLLLIIPFKKKIFIPSVLTLFLLSLIHLLKTPIYFNLFHLKTFISDLLSNNLIILTLWISAFIVIASQKVFLIKNKDYYFFFLIIILAIILVLRFSFSNFLLFYIIFEASLIPTLFIILGWGYQPERFQARFYLIIYTVSASLPLLISIIIIFNSSGSLSLFSFYWGISISNQLINFWWLVTILAFLVKTPLYIVHLWLPKAHVEAPVAGSMILAGILLKLGSYGLFRLAHKFPFYNTTSSSAVVTLRLFGGVIARFICIRQTDIKSLIAYSSVRHIGLTTGGIISNTLWGWHGAFIILIAHGLCSSCLFALANITYESTQRRRLYITKGLLNLFPFITFWWFCLRSCNIAAPPSLNLAGEILLITRNLSYSIITSLSLAIISFIAAVYSLILYTSTQHGQSPSFINSINLLTPRNYSISFFHLTPLILIILNLNSFSLWLWPYSWITTLNCRFKSVPYTKAW